MKMLVMITCFLLVGCAIAQEAPRTVPVQVLCNERLGPLDIDRMALGQGGLSEEPMWSNRIPEIRALRPRLIRLFIQEYFDLLPEKGRYHFDTLDRSVNTILATGAKPLMCICFKPKSLFPVVNQDIVEPNDYEEWERLIFNLVKHYRESGGGIRDWEVSNEPDIGEGGGCPYRFKPESYARYYKHTVAAILRADPEARVGGPALANCRSPILPALLDLCETEKIPLDFVSWHIYSSSPRQIRETIDYVKNLLKQHPTLKPETILNEWNMSLGTPPSDVRFQPCFILEVIWQMKEGGLDASCYYHIRDYHVSFERFEPFMSPQGTAFMTRWWNRMPQFDGLFDYQDNVRPSYFAFKLLSRLAGERLRLTSSEDSVHGFATYDSKLMTYNILLWNFSSSPASVDLRVKGLPRRMRAHHVSLDALTASSDENSRLHPQPSQQFKEDEHRLQIQLGPYAIESWSLE